ncbi:MAG: hypothetical protein ACREV1_19600, partial [Gammaproteobacteria bacterium]
MDGSTRWPRLTTGRHLAAGIARPADPALQQSALTKRDLLRYFAQVSPYILPHLAARPLTMIRMPDGIKK